MTLFISQWRKSLVTSVLQTQSGPDRCKNVKSKEDEGKKWKQNKGFFLRTRNHSKGNKKG